MKIKLHSPYNHFPNYIPQERDKHIECFNDSYVTKDIPKGSIALLIEPRPLQPRIYEYMEINYEKFSYVFTHDSILLSRIPNAKLIIWGGVWGWADEEKDFSHPVSMVASWKEEAPVRIERKRLAKELEEKIDCYGTYDGGAFATTHDIYARYPFSIVIENHIDDYWITEKICNCFSHNTVPIYWGAGKIDEFFNPDGIIKANSTEDIKRILRDLRPREEYFKRQQAIKDNRERVREYESFEKWFMRKYENLLEGI